MIIEHLEASELRVGDCIFLQFVNVVSMAIAINQPIKRYSKDFIRITWLDVCDDGRIKLAIEDHSSYDQLWNVIRTDSDQ